MRDRGAESSYPLLRSFPPQPIRWLTLDIFRAVSTMLHKKRDGNTACVLGTIVERARLTYRLEDVLIDAAVAQWLEVSPVERRLACARASAE
jgi:hypothetical protein